MGKKQKEPDGVALAAEAPLSESVKQLISSSKDRERRAAELPQIEDGKLTIGEISGQDGFIAALEKIKDMVKTDHTGAAWAAISAAAAGKSVRDIDASLNVTLQQLAALQPQSHLETLLIAQMLQVATAAEKCMALAFQGGQSVRVMEISANFAIKFQRTFVAQIEALQRLRGKGGQKVTVEHVHVHEGGQAIVGNVETSPGGGGKNEK